VSGYYEEAAVEQFPQVARGPSAANRVESSGMPQPDRGVRVRPALARHM